MASLFILDLIAILNSNSRNKQKKVHYLIPYQRKNIKKKPVTPLSNITAEYDKAFIYYTFICLRRKDKFYNSLLQYSKSYNVKSLQLQLCDFV